MRNVSIKGKSSINLFKLDVNKFRKNLAKECEVQNRQAVRAWLVEALTYIPTYTGTARGTFKPVGRVVKRVVSKLGPAGQPGDSYRAKQKKVITYKGKTFIAGFSAGENYADAVLSTNIENDKIINCFVFFNDLPYVAYNDVNSAPSGFSLPSNPPWRWRKKSNKVWAKYILGEASRKLRLKVSQEIKIVKVRSY